MRDSPGKGSSFDPLEDRHPLDDDIELPLETMYLIDKVVRQRAQMGPIGVDNSELINIEMEEEYKEKNQHLLNLVSGGNKGEISAYSEDKENMDANEVNAKLLARLTAMANSESKSQITSGGKSTYSCSHEEWVRRKEHESKLKIKLIEEAKKDLREQIIKKLQEEEERTEEKKKALSDWENRKKQEEFIKKRDD